MEKPILFNTGMVQEVLDGRKTATRRICRDGNDYSVPDMQFFDVEKRTYAVHNYADREHREKLSIAERTCPVCPNDLLWVREKWCNANKTGAEPDYYYYADTSTCEDYNNTKWKWRPSIHMPKAAARIWLRVTDIKVERLQDMTLDDFLAEGVVLRPEAFNDPDNAYLQAREIFKGVWGSTVPKAKLPEYGWDADPWVWAITFARCYNPAAGLQEGDPWRGLK